MFIVREVKQMLKILIIGETRKRIYGVYCTIFATLFDGFDFFSGQKAGEKFRL